MERMKKVVSLLLCLVMVVGLLPMSIFTANAAETVLDAAIFCSDVHGSTSDLTSVLSGVKTSGVDYSSIGFVGDTCLTVANTTSTVQSTLNDTDIAVMFSYAASHGSDNGADIGDDWDFSGEVKGISDYYLVYTIRETDMQSDTGADEAFTTWYSGLTDAQKKLPIFIMSHRPLHARRNDNAGAAGWYTAISAAAKTSDIVFFWAHNHTGETSVDTDAYYVAKNGTETISVQGGSTVIPNFTYMNAGYINANNQDPARLNVATTVQITADSMIFQDYTTSGEYTNSSYSHNVTVAREFADTTDSGDSGTTTPTTPSEGEDEETTTYNYTATANTDGTGYILVSNGYALQNNGGTIGSVAVTVSDDGSTITFDDSVDVSTILWTIDSDGDVMNDGYYLLRASGSGTKSMTISTSDTGDAYSNWTYSNDTLTTTGGSSGSTTFYAYCSSGTFSTQSSSSQEMKFYVPATGTSSGGSTEGGDSGDDDTTGGSTETVVGDATVTTADDGSWQKVSVKTTTTTTEPKTVYVLSSGNPSGSVLIADSATAGDVHLVANDGGDLSNTSTTVIYGDCDGDGDSEYYIELSDTQATNSLWTVSNSYRFQNQDEYLRCSNGSLSVSSQSTTWSYSSNRLSYKGKNGTYYLRYNNGWTVTPTSSSASSIYFYVPTEVEVEVETETTKTYSVTAEDVKHIFDNDSATAETAVITKSVTDGTPAGTYTYTVESGADIISVDADGNITFSGTEGTATVKVAYTWAAETDVNGDGAIDDGDTYIIWDTITVTASYPYYTVNLTHNSDGTGAEGTTADYVSTPDTIAIKGVKAGDTYDLWAKVYLNGEGEAVTVDSSALTWSTNNSSVISQTADGNIVFTGNEGTAQVTVYYAYTNSEGQTVQATDVVTFSVTKSPYFIPSDGTDDFPEYPNQGAIRFDKTAVAQGNFSQSGIAKVELSMTGVPYGTNVATDVIVMVDMTSSMETNDITAAKLAVQELIETLVYDEENDDYDENIHLFVSSFSSGTSTSNIVITDHLSDVTISTSEELAEAKAAITDSTDGFRDDRHSTTGTHYGVALADVYETMNREGAAENQFVIFVTDGVPTRYWYLNSSGTYTEVTGSNSDDSSLAAGWFDDEGAVTSSFQTEYYTYLIKTAGVPVYTIGANLSSGSDASDLINHMSSNYSPDGKTSTGETKYSFTCTTSGGITDTVLEIFRGIGADIKEAATNVVVEDKIDSHYTMNFSLPSGVTASEAGLEEFYIQAVSYDLDENNERSGDPTVIEKFTFNADGSVKSHVIGTTACGDSCTHVTVTDGKVSKIDGTYFDYTRTVNDDGTDKEIITWNAEKLDRHELALQYFLYLDNSAGTAAADQVDPGTYPTNEYATITYKNFNGKECQQYFPVPTMTWMGAKVTYVFYLVNENGQPVNRAGKVIPFAEAIFVTDPVTYDVTWNEDQGIERLSADYLANGLVPDVYELYDNQAYYEIRVYQTEGVDDNVVNYNYFVIRGASDKQIDSALDTDTTVDNSTTKVYNTKAGTKYDKYGIYSQQNAGTVLDTTYVDENGNVTAGTVTTTVKTESIDYANTTVAFAVVWKPELEPDTVVIDYGLDVVIDVTTNDSLSSGVTGVSTSAPNVSMNSGTYKTSAMGTSTDLLIDDLIVATAKVENLNAVRFTLNESTGMQFKEPVEFFYESECNYYTYDAAGNRTLNTAYMYSSVTVIPATTIYYEDEFVTLKTYTANGTDENGNTIYTETKGWPTNSVAATAVQQQDRPGASKISEALDADNVYGYDAAYRNQSQYSMGNAAAVTVKSGVYATAEFEFYGTGFDIISLTDTTTGVIVVKVYDQNGTQVLAETVNNYYGYARNYYKVTYTYDAETQTWKATSEEKVTALGKSEDVPENPVNGATYTVYETRWETTTSNDPNALYQVPVLKIGDGDTTEALSYGKYKAVITATYMSFMDKNTTDEGYKFYLDAIRIYNPTGNLSDVANKAYVEDGEGWPSYIELRNQIIAAESFDKIASGTPVDDVEGAVFIDGIPNVGENDIADYVNYGPNNEIYLASNQRIAFLISDVQVDGKSIVDQINIGIKSADGKPATYTIMNVANEAIPGIGVTEGDIYNEKIVTLSTTTDMYYDMTEWKDDIVVITNTGTSGIISLTNIKSTYTSAPNATNPTVEEATEPNGEQQISETADVLMASSETAAEEQVNPNETYIYMTVEAAELTLRALNGKMEEEVPEETEPEVTEPETETTEPETEITEPETEVTEPETEVTEPETEATEPETTEPETEATKPETKPEDSNTGKTLIKIIKKLLGWLFG